ncbi:MAG: SLC13 family permease [Peptococcaceae bacterium]|nr:SLC13 family permease [Peptococcaceae bacterium]
MTATAKQANAKYYINSAIAVAIMFLGRFIPAPDPITPLGMTVLGIFVGAIYAWCTVDLLWPSMIALVLFGLSGEQTVTAAWSSLISNGTVGMCLWLMVIVGLLSTTDVTHWVAKWSVSRPWSKGRPWLIVHCLLIATMFCSSIVGGIATIILFMTLAISLCEEVGYKKGDRTSAYICFAVGFYATIGNMLFPFHTAIVANFGFMAAGSNGAYDGTFDYGHYMIFSFATIWSVYIITNIVFKYLIKIDLSKFENYDPTKTELAPLSKAQKISFLLMGIAFILFLGPTIFPDGSIPFVICNKLGIVGSSILMIAVACLIKVDGKPFTTFDKLMRENVMWQVVLMYGTAVTLAGALNTPDAGVSAWIKNLIVPIFEGMSPMVFLIVFMGIALFFTNLINNTVVSAIMLPISYTICMHLGISPIAFTACFVMFVDYAFLLPSSSPCGALMFTYSDWIPRKYLYKYGLLALLITFFMTIALGWPIASALLQFNG